MSPGYCPLWRMVFCVHLSRVYGLFAHRLFMILRLGLSVKRNTENRNCIIHVTGRNNKCNRCDYFFQNSIILCEIWWFYVILKYLSFVLLIQHWFFYKWRSNSVFLHWNSRNRSKFGDIYYRKCLFVFCILIRRFSMMQL